MRPTATQLLVVVTILCASAEKADAHWCHSLWGSAYNVVVRPDGETVTSANGWTLGVAIQNNMGYPLYRFSVVAQSLDASFDVSISQDSAYPAEKSNYLLPGEKIRYIIEATRHDAAELSIADIDFYIGFGNSGQSNLYGNSQGSHPSEDVVIRTESGGLYPANVSSVLPSLPNNSQGKAPSFAAQADHGATAADREAGMERLLQYYCAGGASWNSTGQDNSACPNSPYATHCPSGPYSTIVDSDSAKFCFQHLWSITELGARKGLLAQMSCGPTSCIELFRDRLRCATGEQRFLYKGIAYLVLGYLGPGSFADSSDVRSFLENEAGTGSPSSPVEYAARAALYLQRDTGWAGYQADVVAGTTYVGSENGFVNALCSAALGIVGPNADAYVQALIDSAGWQQPNTSADGSASLPFYNAHLLNLVAWDRRGWTPNAGDSEYPSFYWVDSTPPRAPTGFDCEEGADITAPEVRLSWNQVLLDTSGGSESVAGYRIDWGTSPRTCGSPAEFDSGGDCGYQHTDTTSSGTVITFVPPALSYTDTTYYFSVHAIDLAGNRSAFADPELSCVARAPQHHPVAAISCAPTTVTVPPDTLPVTVTCTCDASSDMDSDIQDCTFTLVRADATTDTQTVAYPGGSFQATFDTVGQSHTISLTVIDANGLTSATPDEVTISINDASNAVPDAEPTADVTTGEAPLTVTFTDASIDNDGTIIAWQWVFWSGNESTQQNPPPVRFATAGTYDVVLTVTDNDGATGTDTVTINVIAPTNSSPDLRFAAVSHEIVAPSVPVTFDAQQVSDPDGDNFTIDWDFGDGNGSTQTTVQHAYAAMGVYDALLSAQDDGTPAMGPSTRSFQITVTANQRPDCSSASVSPRSGAAPLTVTLDASGCTDADVGDALRIDWSLSSYSMSPVDLADAPLVTTFTFDEPDDYDITLMATDDGSPPLQSLSQAFQVMVSTGDTGPSPTVVASCACDSSSRADLALAALLLFGLGLVRRRTS